MALRWELTILTVRLLHSHATRDIHCMAGSSEHVKILASGQAYNQPVRVSISSIIKKKSDTQVISVSKCNVCYQKISLSSNIQLSITRRGQFLANSRYTVGELFTITRTKFIQFN